MPCVWLFDFDIFAFLTILLRCVEHVLWAKKAKDKTFAWLALEWSSIWWFTWYKLSSDLSETLALVFTQASQCWIVCLLEAHLRQLDPCFSVKPIFSAIGFSHVVYKYVCNVIYTKKNDLRSEWQKNWEAREVRNCF